MMQPVFCMQEAESWRKGKVAIIRHAAFILTRGAKTKPGQAHDALSNDMRGLKHAMGPSRRGHGFALIPKT